MLNIKNITFPLPYLKAGGMLIFLICLLPVSWAHMDDTPLPVDDVDDESFVLKNHRVADAGLNIHISGQADDVDGYVRFLKAEKITTVIRLDFEGKAQKMMHDDTERQAVETEGITYHGFNVDYYEFGSEGYYKQMAEIARIIARGNVLVHCRNGAHRAPFTVAWTFGGMGRTWKETLAAVGWVELEEEPGLYGGKYLAGARGNFS